MALRRWLRRHERAFAQAALAVGAALWLGAQAQAADARMSTGAADTCELHYRITPRHDTTPRVLDIELEFPAGTREETFLRLAPQWAGVSDYAQALVGWRGASVGVQVAPADLANRWLVSHARGGTVRVAFQARAALPDPGDDQRTQAQSPLYRTQIGADWFQFFGYGVLPSVEPWGDETTTHQCVTILQPGRPDAVAFGSHFNGRGEHLKFAFTGSPAQLRHAFHGGGAGWRLSDRSLANGPVHIAVCGRFALDDAVFADQAAALIDTQRRFWDDPHASAQAEAQWLVLTPNFMRGNVGGTLVHQAAVLHAGADFSPSHPSFAFLIGHENLHQWIPGRFGAQGGDDPLRERHDWFSEGFSDYYTHRLLLASGLWTLPRCAEELTQMLRGYWRSPARNATAVDIAPRFFSDRDAGRQMYSRGELRAMRWDRALREQGHAGLDAALKRLLLPQPVPPGDKRLAATRVLDGLRPLLGALPQRDVQSHVEDGADIPLDPDLAGPCFRLGWDDATRWVLGFDRASFADRTARGVELSLQTPEGRKDLRYRPADGPGERLPTLAVRGDAAGDAACRAWMRASGG